MTQRNSARTLFAPLKRVASKRGGQSDPPYSIRMQSLANGSMEGVDETEVIVFSDVVTHETFLYEPRGDVAGPLQLSIPGKRMIDLGKRREPFQIPAWVEADGLELRGCDARCLLLVEDLGLYRKLIANRTLRRLPVLWVTGAGIPRLAVRRFMHRAKSDI